MAEQQQPRRVEDGQGEEVEVKERGMFDFTGKEDEKKKEEELVAGIEKMHVKKDEQEKEKPGLVEKLRRSHSASSSSSSDGEEGENGEEKKKKGLKDKLKEKLSGEKKPESDEQNPDAVYEDAVGVEAAVVTMDDSTIKVENLEDASMKTDKAPALTAEENKGFLDKIKEKLPMQGKKPSEEPAAPAPAVAESRDKEDEGKEKKGFLEKIKEKLPGYGRNSGAEGPPSTPAAH